MKLSRPRPQTQLAFSRQTRYGLAARIHQANDPTNVRAASRSHDASDSLVDDWGCLTDRPEREAIPYNIDLQCCRPLNSPLDQSLGKRVFHVFL
jgi:hypothetical protein